MSKTVWALVAVIALILLGGAYWYATYMMPVEGSQLPPQGQPIPGSDVTEQTGGPGGTGTNVPDPSASAALNATITYNESGFSPAVVTIKRGGTVTWNNESSGNMWVASAQHPTHTVYNGTARQDHCGTDQESVAFDQCRGETDDWSFTFEKVGEWAYHDHLNASNFGRIVVVE